MFFLEKGPLCLILRHNLYNGRSCLLGQTTKLSCNPNRFVSFSTNSSITLFSSVNSPFLICVGVFCLCGDGDDDDDEECLLRFCYWVCCRHFFSCLIKGCNRFYLFIVQWFISSWFAHLCVCIRLILPFQNWDNDFECNYMFSKSPTVVEIN